MNVKQPQLRLALPLIPAVAVGLLAAVAALLLGPSNGVAVGSHSATSASGSSLPFATLREGKTTLQSQQRLVSALGSLPLTFEANQGQTDPQVKYLARGHGYTLFLTSDEAVLSMVSSATPQRTTSSTAKGPTHNPGPMTAVLRMQVVGANRHAEVSASEAQSGISNYYIGKDAKQWRAGVRHYGRVAYRNAYPGIDLAFYGKQHQLEFDFIVGAGADPTPIGLRFSGAERVSTDSAGDLVLASSAGDMRFHRPVAYQEKYGARELVDAHFVVDHGEVRFTLGNYDRSRQLVIDPSLTYSVYLGGGGSDSGRGIALDASGNVYVTGEAGDATFPHTSGSFAGGAHDAYVTELNGFSGATIYSTFLGGNQDDTGVGIAVDPNCTANCAAYIVGNTQSGASFPATTTFGPRGGQDAFFAKFDATGALAFATTLGGTGSESGNAIAVDSNLNGVLGVSNIYIAGTTDSTDLPTVIPMQASNGGGKDAFVARVDAGGATLVYSTYLGGSGNDGANSIAVDTKGNVYVTGGTASSNFPTFAFPPSVPIDTTCGSDGTCNGRLDDAFVAELDGAGVFVYSTFLGGSGSDDGEAIAVDSSGAAYVAGNTNSVDFPTFAIAPNVPAKVAYGGGSSDLFVTKISPNANGVTPIVFSTYLGAAGSEQAFGLALDHSKNVWVTGVTDSSNFPRENVAFSSPNGASDAFVGEVSSTGAAFPFSSYLGGSGDEDMLGGGIAVDTTGNVYVTGDSNSTDFPLALNPYGGGSSDGFVARLASPPAFGVGVAPNSTVVASGQSTTPFTITVTPQPGFGGNVTFACSGLPALAYCNFNPTFIAGGTGTTQLTIATTSNSAMLAPPGTRTGLVYALLLVPGFMFVGASVSPGRQRKFMGALLGCILFSGLALTACGGGGGGRGTPPGIYMVTVKGTAGSTAVNGTPMIVMTVK